MVIVRSLYPIICTESNPSVLALAISGSIQLYSMVSPKYECYPHIPPISAALSGYWIPQIKDPQDERPFMRLTFDDEELTTHQLSALREDILIIDLQNSTLWSCEQKE